MLAFWTPTWRTASGFVAALGLAGSATAEETACRAVSPADLAGPPAHWLGACPGGAAEGLGVLRVGTHEPYQFFMGEMKAGRPQRGLMKLADGWEAVGQFDAALHANDSKSWDPKHFEDTYQAAEIGPVWRGLFPFDAMHGGTEPRFFV